MRWLHPPAGTSIIDARRHPTGHCGVRLMILRSPARLVAAVIVPALLVAACGGGAASTAPDGNVVSPTTAVALPSDVALPSGLALPSDLAIPSFDLSGLVGNLKNVDSYKVLIDSGGETYSGTVITKPVAARDLLIGTGADATHVVTIGDEAWMGTGDGPLESSPSALVASIIPLFDPSVLLSVFANQGILQYAENLGQEDKNGQPTTHYKVDVSKIPNLAALGMPAGAALEMWVADDGYLVSFVAKDFGGTGSDLAMDVTNVNDPANVVERPR